MTAGHATRRCDVIDDARAEEEAYIEDQAVEVRSYGGVVIAGLGSTIWAHPGVTVDVENGATVYLAPGAFLLEERPGALEHGDFSVVDWLPPTTGETS